MLAKANRVIRPGDFRLIVRRGRRVNTDNAVIYVLTTPENQSSRFGFIVTKAVGGSVVRNAVRRRLRAICRDSLARFANGKDIVVRPQPSSVGVSWSALYSEITEGIGGSVNKA